MILDNKHEKLLAEIRSQNKIVLDMLRQAQETLATLVTKDALKKVADKVKIIKSMFADTKG